MAKSGEKRALRGRAGRMQGGRGSGRASTGQVRLWGRHAVEAALMNPDRSHRKLWATREGIASLNGELPADFPLEYADAHDLSRLVAKDAPHQGLVLECAPLDDVFLDAVMQPDAPDRPIVVLDQVTDPHNMGAILRSAAAFNACAVVT
ncbi:MAG: 23S rRNA (guanosine(2251)-2'-O)-methyltransferase RlmB, partial [Proteobacteria bacterium]